jgi:hypothetical protein
VQKPAVKCAHAGNQSASGTKRLHETDTARDWALPFFNDQEPGRRRGAIRGSRSRLLSRRTDWLFMLLPALLACEYGACMARLGWWVVDGGRRLSCLRDSRRFCVVISSARSAGYIKIDFSRHTPTEVHDFRRAGMRTAAARARGSGRAHTPRHARHTTRTERKTRYYY